MTRLGSQEPTKSRIIPFITTEAEESIQIYKKSGRDAYDWQVGLLQAILAKNKSGLWTHMKFGYSVPRQNGKNEVVAIRELYGLHKGEKILHTAHRTTTSATAFNRLLAIMEDMGLVEGEDFFKIKAIGREQIRLVGGGIINFRTRTATGGLGESYDILIIDEAQEYTDEQESTLKYTIASSENPQTILLGTPPTPVSSGTVFTTLRKQALEEQIEDIGWAEWSIPDESDPREIELWYQTNPSLGYRLTERTIRSEVGEDDIDFNIQRLGLWIRYNQKSEISENEWNDLKVSNIPKLHGKLFVGIKYGHDGKNVALSIAVKDVKDNIFIEVIDCRNLRSGNTWILSFLKKADIRTVVVDGANGQNLLASDMKDLNIKNPILPTVKNIIDANALFEQGLFQKTISHKGQASLSSLVTNIEKRNIGTNGGFGYRSQVDDLDVSILDSLILAHWACFNAKEKRVQRVKY